MNHPNTKKIKIIYFNNIENKFSVHNENTINNKTIKYWLRIKL